MTKPVAAEPGQEVWRNVLQGPLHYFTLDRNGQRQRRTAKGDGLVRVTPYERELITEEIASPAKNPFLNGRLKRVDNRVAAVDEETGGVSEEDLTAGKTELPLDHKVDLALDKTELGAILEKNGAAFQAAVRKLDERNVRTLLDIADEGGAATVAQLAFLRKFIEDTYRLSKAQVVVEPSAD